MSFGLYRKMLSCLGVSAFFWLALPTAAWAQGCGVQFGTPCAAGCESHHCPPPFQYTYEGGPRIHWHCGCPHPICNPCDLPHWGYYETCWSPYPFPPNWTHCPALPPAAMVSLNPYFDPNMQPPVAPRGSFGMPQSGPGPATAPAPKALPSGGDAPDLPLPRRYDGRRGLQ